MASAANLKSKKPMFVNVLAIKGEDWLYTQCLFFLLLLAANM